MLELRFLVLTHSGVSQEPPCHNQLPEMSVLGQEDNSWLFGQSTVLHYLTFFLVRTQVVMNSFRFSLPATCQFRNSPVQCGISYVLWDPGQPIGSSECG